jgi:hypothetical protein
MERSENRPSRNLYKFPSTRSNAPSKRSNGGLRDDRGAHGNAGDSRIPRVLVVEGRRPDGRRCSRAIQDDDHVQIVGVAETVDEVAAMLDVTEADVVVASEHGPNPTDVTDLRLEAMTIAIRLASGLPRRGAAS